ncbi:thioredoxin-like protein, partial [Aspergillus ruber CBS 135680]
RQYGRHNEFSRIINRYKFVVVVFWAAWCGPCRIISPEFEKLSNDKAFSQVDFYKIDIDEQVKIATEVGIRQIPTFVLFKYGAQI